MSHLGGVTLIIRALRRHKHHADMQRWGYKALRSLASSTDLATIGSKASATEAKALAFTEAAKDLSDSKQPLIARKV